MRKLRDILWAHFREQIRREYIQMLETGTTSEAQLNRITTYLAKSVSSITHSVGRIDGLSSTEGQVPEISDLVSQQEHRLMSVRIDR